MINPDAPKANTGTPIQTAPQVPTPAVTGETPDQRIERENRAAKAIREILVQEHCTITVPVLDISSGRVFPKPQVMALDLPVAAPAAAQ
jgi:hypothetical protein